MKFKISRDALMKPLNLVAGVVERRQTLPILSNVKIELDDGVLSLTGTDLEVELVGRIELGDDAEVGEVTVPARKLADICKSLPDGSEVEFSVDGERVVVRSGRSRFTLSTLPANDFPSIDQAAGSLSFSVNQAQLKRLIERTSFSMAQQDVRYYLNGMLFEVSAEQLRTVATDGHRLAMSTLNDSFDGVKEAMQVILPRKGVLELQRLLQDPDADVNVVIGSNHFHASTPEFTFTSKLVDGKFPDYERVLPRGATSPMLAQRTDLRDSLSRTAILSNEKYRGVRLIVDNDTLDIHANNPEQEEAEESIGIEYAGERIEIGFNVGYLIDVLGVLQGPQVRFQLTDGASSVLIEDPEDEAAMYVVMPMRL